MKKLVSTLVAAGVIASAVAADSTITAVKVSTALDNVSYSSDVWSQAKFSEVILYPQTTIKFNDKKANELNANNSAIKATVAALYNGTDIAFMIKWPDGTKSIQQGYKTDSYADGFAIQFASDYTNPKALPYIGMGSDDRSVLVHLQKETDATYEPNGNGDVSHQVNPNQTDLFDKDLANFNNNVDKLGNSDYEKSFVSEGFRSMTEIKDGSNRSTSSISYEVPGFFGSLFGAKSQWNGTVSRSIKDDYLNLDSGVIPVAFAVWDGDKLGRNGLKYLTSWTAVKLQDKSGGDKLLAALTATTEGDIAKGKEEVINNCVACHQIDSSEAENLMGPALTNIGGYSTVDYIVESLVDPSAVVVPGYNRNAHSNYAWYNIEDGKRVSAMPAFDWMEEATRNNIVAYLKTLKAEVK